MLWFLLYLLLTPPLLKDQLILLQRDKTFIIQTWIVGYTLRKNLRSFQDATEHGENTNALEEFRFTFPN